MKIRKLTGILLTVCLILTLYPFTLSYGEEGGASDLKIPPEARLEASDDIIMGEFLGDNLDLYTQSIEEVYLNDVLLEREEVEGTWWQNVSGWYMGEYNSRYVIYTERPENKQYTVRIVATGYQDNIIIVEAEPDNPPKLQKPVDALVDEDVILTFSDDETWRNSVKEVMVGDKLLTADTDYELAEGKLILKPSVWNGEPGTAFIVRVKAEGYKDAVLTNMVVKKQISFAAEEVELGKLAKITYDKNNYKNWKSITIEKIQSETGEIFPNLNSTTKGLILSEGMIWLDTGNQSLFQDGTGSYEITIQPGTVHLYNETTISLVVKEGPDLKDSPTLKVDTSTAIINHEVDINFADDGTWRKAVTHVLIDNKALTSGSDYTLEEGKLKLLPSEWNDDVGQHVVTMIADGYRIAQESFYIDKEKEIPPDQVVLVIQENNRTLKSFTFGELNEIAQEEGDISYTYSARNSYGTFELTPNSPTSTEVVKGPTLETLLEKAYGKELQEEFADYASVMVTTRSPDTFQSKVSLAELMEERYYFENSEADSGLNVPAIICTTVDMGKLMFGQTSPNEMNNPAWVKKLFVDSQGFASGTISIERDATFPAFAANYITGATIGDVKVENNGTGSSTAGKNRKVSFDFNKMEQYASVYYTVSKDGTEPAEPTVKNGTLYTVKTYEEPYIFNEPRLDTVGTTIIKAKVFRLGWEPSPTYKFTFTVTGNSAPDLKANTTDASVGKDLTLSFKDGAEWSKAVTEVLVNGVSAAQKYTLSEGSLVLDSSLFPKEGDYEIEIRATGYVDIVISQKVPSEGGGGSGGDNPKPDDAVLSVYEGSTLKKAFTQSDINKLPQKTRLNYSHYNTWPTWEKTTGISGVALEDILEEAGVKTKDLGKNTELKFTSSDGYRATLTAYQALQQERYYYSSQSSTSGTPVPTVISFSGVGRLYLGQAVPSEQVEPAYVKKMIGGTITIGKSAGSWDKPTADPASGSTVKKGDLIRLESGTTQEDAKIYYTLDGKTPNMSSEMYNLVADRWLSDKNMKENKPISAPSDGPFVIKAYISGLGKGDGSVVSFYYNGATESGAGASNTGKSNVSSVTVGAQAKQDKDGNASASVSASDITDALKKAAENKKKDEDGVEVKIEVSGDTNANSVETSLPKSAVNEVAGTSNSQMALQTSLGTVTMSKNFLSAAVSQASGSDLKIRLAAVAAKDDPALSEAAQKTDKIIEIAIASGSKEISDFKGESMTLALPYNLDAGKAAAGVVAYSVDADGKLTQITGAKYDAAAKAAVFTTKKPGRYAIGYDAKAAALKFTDVTGHWAEDAINYVVGEGLFNGTSETTFSPNGSMTRAMFVTVLGRMSGADPKAYTKSSFSDVSLDSYYGGYVEWASANGIVKGVGEGMFAPDRAVTREQMAKMLLDYYNYLKKGPEGSWAIQLKYTDLAQVADWAVDGVMFCTLKELITGYSDGTFRPKNTATRAEVATILMRVSQAK